MSQTLFEGIRITIFHLMLLYYNQLYIYRFVKTKCKITTLLI